MSSIPSLRSIADAIATRFDVGEAVTWEQVRDVADFHTGGDMSYVRLNILTDMVMQRIAKGYEQQKGERA